MPPKDDFPDWIDSVAKFARKLGMNDVRVRWRLMAWHKSWKRQGAAAERAATHVGYEHKICPSCGAINDRESKQCAKCSSALDSRFGQMLRRMGLHVPQFLSLSTLLIVGCCLVYFRIMTESKGGALFTVASDVLVRHGAAWSAAFELGQWWRLSTAIFVHIGLWHLSFNAMALAQVGPLIEEIFGRGRMLVFFIVTGIFASLATEFLGVTAICAGASGALMGLCGVAAGWGQRDGSAVGRNLRGEMLKWALYTVVFGFFIGANNVAHISGFVGGAALGFVVPPTLMRKRNGLRVIETILVVVCAGIAIGSVAIAMFPLDSSNALADQLRIMTQH